MVRKKIDNRIRILIENGVKLGHRTLFAIIGDKARDQVPILHQMLSKAEVKAQPTVLWCYKKDLGFSSHQTKRRKHDQLKFQAGKLNINEDDPFEMFRSSTKIRYCYYSETHKILGNTFGMCILQDFEALTPNLLARTIETVEGGGLIIILLRSVASLQRLYTMRMDVHEKYRTEVHQNVTCRFNERFFLSLTSCKRCLIVDDQLSVLPITPHTLHVTPEEVCQEKSENDIKLDDLKTELRDTEILGNLVSCCRTLDQGVALLKFIEAITDKTLRSTVSLTAGRGRGKSATLGLSVAAAIAFGYSNIFVTSPSPENLKTFFEFVFKGLEALEYKERSDYEINTHPDFNKVVVKVKVTKDHLQTIQYIHPKDSQMLLQAQLVVIDEAAAIPLPFVKSLLGPYLVFLASTNDGYEGTGRSLTLKLLQQLRVQVVPLGANTNAILKKDTAAATGRSLLEITLKESIRYKPGDLIEQWLTKLLCLDANSVAPLSSGCPSPDNCDLYYVSRDTLFSYNDATEEFLQRLVALLVASHYKNSPDDLQMMSDAPGHHLFCLLGPVGVNRKKLPEVLAIVHIALEGQIPNSSTVDGISSNKRLLGDIIPWTVSHEFSDPDFSQLYGARIVRIATHPDYQGMGYGSRALQLLKDYYELKIFSIDEFEDNVNENPVDNDVDDNDDEMGFNQTIKPKTSLPPLLLKLSERRPERLNYLGVSFGLSTRVLKFWKKAGYVPVHVKSKANDLTGEHSCIMLNVLNDHDMIENDWLLAYWTEFRTRFVELLGYQAKQFSCELGLSLLLNTSRKVAKRSLARSELEYNFTSYGLKSLERYKYSNNSDYDSIMHLLPTLSKLYFLNQMGDLQLPMEQAILLLGIGLQRKTVGDLAVELGNLPTQVQAFFKQIIIKFSQYLNSVLEDDIAKTLVPTKDVQMTAVGTTLIQELDEAAKELEKKQKKELQKLKNENLAQFAIKGSEDEWGQVLTKKGKKNIISIKSGEKRLHESKGEVDLEEKTEKKKKKNEKMKKGTLKKK